MKRTGFLQVSPQKKRGPWLEASSPVSIAISPESIEKSFHTAGRLVFQDFDAAFHLWGGQKELASAIRRCQTAS